MRRLDFSVAPEPVIYVQFGGWPDGARSTFVARSADLPGVRRVVEAVGATYVYYDAASSDEDVVCVLLTSLADEVFPGHDWLLTCGASGMTPTRPKRRGFNYRDSSSGRFTNRREAEKSPATHERERRT